MVEKKLKELGIELPEAAKPVAAYVPAVKAGDFVYTAGQIPVVDGQVKYTGQIGKARTVEEGYEAAKICAINCLSAVKSLIGSLDKVEQIVKLTGFVNTEPGYGNQPLVINGASEFLLEVFGEKGAHARSAVGVSGLPLDSLVEIEMIVKVKG